MQVDVALLDAVVLLARQAAAEVMAVYETAFEVRRKDDASPVTEADERAEAVILAGLAKLTPDLPVVAEEAVAAGREPEVAGRPFWLVDPLDGTKEFISRNGEFTVNIALVVDGAPVLGVVVAPAIGAFGGCVFAGAQGLGAWQDDGRDGRRAISCRPVPEEGWSVVASRSHGDAAALDSFLQGRKVARQISAGSSLKLCLVASGQADVYPRLGRTMEWDIAAGDAVLRAAGGSVRRIDDNQLLRYGKSSFENPHFWASAQSRLASA